MSAFSSWSAFFAMGGYAFFVWLAVAFTLVPLLCLVVHIRLQRRTLLHEIRRIESREIRLRNREAQ